LEERIIVYLGPSLPLDRARKILPDAVYQPPARQGDIVSDLSVLQPNIIILIDGTFRDNLSVWTKELLYALQYPGIKAIYGAASMGALRAAELDFVGMIGIGQIYAWYRDGITDDDSEVAVQYAERNSPKGPIYYVTTVPLVDIRAGMEHYRREFPDHKELNGVIAKFFTVMQATPYMDRTEKLCEDTWDHAFGIAFPRIPQKELDAIEALETFNAYVPDPKIKPNPDHLSTAFHALYERDRKIDVKGQQITQQHLDSYVILHNPEYERICWDAANQELALLLCDALFVMVTIEEVEHENNRFQKRSGVATPGDFEMMLEANGWGQEEYKRLMLQNARIRKLQHAMTVSKHSRRNTQSVLDYLRTHQAFDYWAEQAARKESDIATKGVDEWMGLTLEKSAWEMLHEHFESEGLDLKCSHEDYLLETGFSNQHELSVALTRLSLAKEQ